MRKWFGRPLVGLEEKAEVRAAQINEQREAIVRAYRYSKKVPQRLKTGKEMALIKGNTSASLSSGPYG